jgi:phosphoribosyl 1,2-cyclic phosphodiesterase
MDRVKAIFVSHEHDDHIKGIEVLSHRYKLPVYITDKTLAQCRFCPDRDLTKSFDAASPVIIGSLTITAFAKTHDASDPYSFIVASSTVRIGIFTDLGYVCDNLIRHFSLCHAAFLESNYDEQLLENGRYPWPLKNRIRGGQGHLSNRQALELFADYRPPFMSHLLLAHLSQDNNSPELVQSLFDREAHGTTITIASRHNESEIYAIDGSHNGSPGPSWTPQGIRKPADAVGAIPTGATPRQTTPERALAPTPPVPAFTMRARKKLTPQPKSTQIALF